MGFWNHNTNMRGLSLACCVLCAGLVFSQETTESSAPEEITAAPAAPSTEAPVVIIKQVNEINDDGTYTVGYEASDGSFKLETKDAEGNVEGKYGFVDEDGEIKIVEYSANNSTGFTSDLELPTPDLPVAVSGDAADAAPAPVDPAFALEQQRHAAVIAHQKSVVERQQLIARQRDDAAQRQAFANQRGQSPRRPVFNAANFNPSRPASEQFNTQNFNQDFQQFQQRQQQPQQFAQQPRQQFAQQPQQQFAQQPSQFNAQFSQNQQFAQNPQQFAPRQQQPAFSQQFAPQQQQQFAPQPQQPALTPVSQLTREQIALEGFSRDEDGDGQIDPLPAHLQPAVPQQQFAPQQPQQFQQRQQAFQPQSRTPQFRTPQPVAPSPAGQSAPTPQLTQAQLNQLFAQAQQQQRQAPQQQFAPQQQQQFAPQQQQFAPQQQQFA